MLNTRRHTSFVGVHFIFTFALVFNVCNCIVIQASLLLHSLSIHNMVEVSLKHGVRFSSAKEFYPFYLTEHRNRTCRRLHCIGTSGAITMIIAGALTQVWSWIPLGIVFGYGMAWIGHFFFEKNKPAAFKYPVFSFICDLYLVRDMISGEIKF